jgi:hypothetical protein
MRDLTREEQHELIRLLGLVAENGRGSVAQNTGQLNELSVHHIMALVRCAERVRDACVLDLQNQVG